MQIEPMQNSFNAQCLQNFEPLQLKFPYVDIKDYGRVWSSQYQSFVGFDRTHYIANGSVSPPLIGYRVGNLQRVQVNSLTAVGGYLIPAVYGGGSYLWTDPSPWLSNEGGGVTPIFYLPPGTTVSNLPDVTFLGPPAYYFWYTVVSGPVSFFFPYSVVWYYGKLTLEHMTNLNDGSGSPDVFYALNMAYDGHAVWKQINNEANDDYYFNMIAVPFGSGGVIVNDLTSYQQLGGVHFFGKLLTPNLYGGIMSGPYVTQGG